MKALLLIAAVFAFFSANASAVPQQFEEGTHYEVLDGPPSEQPEIVEYFSFYCMACFRFEPIAQQLQTSFSDRFRKSHTSGLSPSPGMGEKMNQAYALALLLNKDSEFNAHIFEQNFVKREPIDSEQKLAEVFGDIGVGADEFEKGFNSFSVRAKARQMDQEASRRDVRGTPTLIINGKYKININGFRDSDDLTEDLTSAITFLLAR